MSRRACSVAASQCANTREGEQRTVERGHCDGDVWVEKWEMDVIEYVWEYKVDGNYDGDDGGLAFVVGGLQCLEREGTT